MSGLLRGIAALSVGTCLTLMILIGYFAAQGSLNVDTATKIVALLNGIDITGNRLQQVLNRSEDREEPDFDEVLAARKLESLDMDLRLRSQTQFRDELNAMLANLSTARQRFDERREAFDRRLKELEEGALDEGIQQLQRILQEMEPNQAKDQLERMFKDESIDQVVNIVQAMPSDKRKDILAEFDTPQEDDILYEIIRRIGEGLPITSLIDKARGDS